MNRLNIRAFLLNLVALLWFQIAWSQSKPHPFAEEIRAFKRADAQQLPPKKATLFVGSSSIRFWEDVASRFPDEQIINRGFGGSGLDDLLYYADQIVFPYQPSQIFIYSGENDLVANKSAQWVLTHVKTLVNQIHQQLPKTRVYYISIKPSPSRRHVLPEVRKANQLIKNYLATQRKCYFIDVFEPMLNTTGQPKPEIFTSDSLHMNTEGYDLWTEIIKPYVK